MKSSILNSKNINKLLMVIIIIMIQAVYLFAVLEFYKPMEVGSPQNLQNYFFQKVIELLFNLGIGITIIKFVEGLDIKNGFLSLIFILINIIFGLFLSLSSGSQLNVATQGDFIGKIYYPIVLRTIPYFGILLSCFIYTLFKNK